MPNDSNTPITTAAPIGFMAIQNPLKSNPRSKLIVLVISDQKLPVEKWQSEGFLLLPSVFLGAP